MRCLLDTHTWVWAQLQPERLSRTAAALIADPSAGACLSPVTLYEVHLLVERGRVQIEMAPLVWIRTSLIRRPFPILDVTAEIAVGARNLEGYTNPDPFDRLLLATARAHLIPIVTKDASMHTWGGVPVIW